MGCTASCKSCEGVAQNYSVDIGAPDEKDPDEVNEENEGEENPAELYKDFFFEGGVLPKRVKKNLYLLPFKQILICYTPKTYMTMGKTTI